MIAITTIIISIFIPILSILFCANLVSIIKKVRNAEDTEKNTIWLTVSFTLIVWSIGIAALT